MNPNHEMRGNYVRTNDRKCQMRYPKVFTIEMTKEIDATTNDVVAPWWNISYEEQLSRKEKEMRQVLKRCNRRIAKKDREKEKKAKEGGRAGSIKQPCNEFLRNGHCKYGDRCKYLHLSIDEYEKMVREEKEAKEKDEDEKKDGEKHENEQQPEKEVTMSSDDDGGVEYSKVSEEDGQICTMLPILTAEPHEGYRNKCSFTIGILHSSF